MVGNFRDGLHLLRRRQRRAGRGRSCGHVAPSAVPKRRDAARGALRNIAFDRREPEYALITQPHAQRIDKLAYIDFGAASATWRRPSAAP